MTTKKTARRRKAAVVPAAKALREMYGELTMGRCLRSIREGEEWTLAEMAARLGVARQHLSNIESGLKGVSPGRAAEWAKLLGYDESTFVELAVRDLLRRDGLNYSISIEPAPRRRTA